MFEYFSEDFVILALLIVNALILFSETLLLRRMLILIKKSGIWILPLIGVFLILMGCMFSLFEILEYFTDIEGLYFIKFILAIFGNLFAFSGFFIYYGWTSRG